MSKHRSLNLAWSVQITQDSEWVNIFTMLLPWKGTRMLWAIDAGLTLLYTTYDNMFFRMTSLFSLCGWSSEFFFLKELGIRGVSRDLKSDCLEIQPDPPVKDRVKTLHQRVQWFFGRFQSKWPKRLLLWWGLVFMYNEKLVVYCKFSIFFVWCCLWKRAIFTCIFIILCGQTGFPNCSASDGYRWVVDSALRTLDTQRQRLEDREAFPPTASWLSYGLAMCHQSW